MVKMTLKSETRSVVSVTSFIELAEMVHLRPPPSSSSSPSPAAIATPPLGVEELASRRARL